MTQALEELSYHTIIPCMIPLLPRRYHRWVCYNSIITRREGTILTVSQNTEIKHPNTLTIPRPPKMLSVSGKASLHLCTLISSFTRNSQGKLRTSVSNQGNVYPALRDARPPPTLYPISRVRRNILTNVGSW